MRAINFSLEGCDPYKELIEPLSGSGFFGIVGVLPAPSSTYICKKSGVVFEIYKAKQEFDSRWKDANVLRLVIEARGSYYRYGHYPPLDKYDSKAAVYLIRVRAPSVADQPSFEEWHSIRFIPANGAPQSNDDLEMLWSADQPVRLSIKSKLFPRNKNFLEHLVSISRICATPRLVIGENSYEVSSAKRQYTGECFALANKVFLSEAKRIGKRFDYITGLFRDELISGALLAKNTGLSVPNFTPAYKLLKLKSPKAVKVNRKVLAYRFPGYFLKSEQLSPFLNALIGEGKLFLGAVNNCLEVPDARALLSASFLPHDKLRLLGDLFSAKGKIAGSLISGKDLRRLLDAKIDDGPELKMMKVGAWEKSIDKALKIYGANTL